VKLGKRLAVDESSDVRLHIINALREIEDKRAIPFLIRALESDSDKTIKAHAAWGLGAFATAPKDVGPPLIRALNIDSMDIEDAAIIGRAIGSLSLLDFPVVPQLLEAIKNPNFRGRSHALEAMAMFFRNVLEEERLTGKAKTSGDIKIALP